MLRVLTASCLLLASAALFGIAAAQEKAPQQSEGWGTVADPDGDCTIRQEDGKVTIKVPNSMHDFWVGRPDEKKRFNAPRVWREVKGDFVAQVRVTADWKNAGPPTKTNYQYIGAGLVVWWDSGKEYVRLERNLFDHPKLGAICYTTPLHDRDGKRVNAWKTGKAAEFFKGNSTWLRVLRSGEKITTSVSHDGKEWTETAVLTTELPKTVRVGVLAINCSTGEFAAEFDKLRVLRRKR